MKGCRTTMTKPPQSLGDLLLWGLVALSLPLAGWLLGYGLAPWINDSPPSLSTKPNSGKFSTSVPVWRQGWTPLNETQRIKSNGYER